MAAKKTDEKIKSGKNEHDREKIANSPFDFVGLDGKKYRITLRQKLFAEFYLELKGSGVDAVYEAGYNPTTRNSAMSIASENLRKLEICAYITTKLEEYGFSDDNVEKQHLYLINQFDDLSAKSKGIDLFYKVKNKYPAERVIDETSREKIDALSDQIKEWIGAK